MKINQNIYKLKWHDKAFNMKERYYFSFNDAIKDMEEIVNSKDLQHKVTMYKNDMCWFNHSMYFVLGMDGLVHRQSDIEIKYFLY